jgi:tetratricopeptide (TPR) repeat protein
MDQPVTCLYEGDPERDDFSLLQVEDAVVVAAEFGKDFDPGDEFLSFGFSNDGFYGAPIRGEITAFARCGALGDQKLIRLETFSDAQRIEGGQSGAPVFVYQKGQYKVIGLIVASEDLNGGLAIPTSTILGKVVSLISLKLKFNKSLYIAVASLSVIIASSLFIFFSKSSINLGKCSRDYVYKEANSIEKAIKDQQYTTALNSAEDFAKQCPDEYRGKFTQGMALTEMRRYEEAIKAFQASIDIKPTVDAIYNLNLVRGRAKQFEEAIDGLESLLTNPLLTKQPNPKSYVDHQKIFYSLGFYHHKLARTTNDKAEKLFRLEKAKKSYLQAITRTDNLVDSTSGCCSPQRAEAAYHLAAVYSVIYFLDNRDKDALNKAIEAIKIGFKSVAPEKQMNDLKEIESSNKNDLLKEIAYIRSTQEFSDLRKWLNEEAGFPHSTQ